MQDWSSDETGSSGSSERKTTYQVDKNELTTNLLVCETDGAMR